MIVHVPGNNMDDLSTKIQTLRPTLEEFKDFMQCIERAEANGAHHAGLLKVIPPKEWVARKAGYEDVKNNYQIKTPIRQRPEGQGGFYQIQNHVMKNSDYQTFKMLNKKGHKPPRVDSIEELEKRYWEAWDTEELAPVYGADMEGTLTDPDVEEFNLNKLDSILNDLNQNGVRISGVNTAYLYFGLWRSSFTLHTEDCDLYSINYLHFGKPKHWYTVPPEHGHKLEELAKNLFPDMAKKCPSFLRHKTTVISPEILKIHNIPYNKVVQHPGEFIITFPFGYHFGFNLGLNCAEATNFALPRWIDFGKNAASCYCRRSNVHINMDCFVKKYQPDQYDDWMSQQYPKASPTSLPESHDSGIVEEKKESKKNILPRKRSAPSLNIKNFVSANKKRLDYSTIEEVQEEIVLPPSRKTFDELKRLNIQFVGSENQSSSFENEKEYNLRLSKFEPFCAVCSTFKYCPEFEYFDMSRFEMNTPERFKIYTSLPGQVPDGDRLLKCSSCNVSVHRACYNIQHTGDIADWRCDRCSAQTLSASCFLCPYRGGALKKTTREDEWAHVSCSRVIPNISFVDNIINVNDIQASLDLSPCTFCEKLFANGIRNGTSEHVSTSQFPEYIRGYTINCKKCKVAYHVGCGINSGIVFDSKTFESYCGPCRKSEQKTVKSQKDLEEPEIEEIVIAKIDLYYSYARVKEVQTETFHKIQFIDSTKDVTTIIQYVHNPPQKNDNVGVLVDNRLEFGNYKSSYDCPTYTVQFDTGYKLKLKRHDFFLMSQGMSKKVYDKFIESIEPLNFEVL